MGGGETKTKGGGGGGGGVWWGNETGENGGILIMGYGKGVKRAGGKSEKITRVIRLGGAVKSGTGVIKKRKKMWGKTKGGGG